MFETSPDILRQPAMDHLLENSDNAIPDPSTQTTSGADGENLDEDDQDAVTAHIKKMGGTVTESDLVPRVCPFSRRYQYRSPQ